ncbi:DUF4760 domain-containing protein [Shewanella algae]|uniref:DUF4760 domain-containing protein n=1 Tax=Shewanella algae TaxID=38313 RepID=UPI0011844E2C|nr:DUF4760 domain-containing protein [Shewanella algae]TVL33320.1 hypothetical protein AYI94_17780 [Shewanella algae]
MELIYNIWEVSPSFFAITISAVVAAVIALSNIFSQKKLSREKNSLDFQESFKSSAKVNESLRLLFDAYYNRHNIPLELYASDKKLKSTDTAEAIRFILNEWERAANAIKHKIYDDKFLYEAHASIVIFLSVNFRTFIRKTQEVNPRYYIHFTWLSLKWTIRRDSFEHNKTEKQLKIIFRALNRVKSGKLQKEKVLKSIR